MKKSHLKTSPFRHQPSLLFEGDVDLTDLVLEHKARALGLGNFKLGTSQWRSCPHCRLLGFKALFRGKGLAWHLTEHRVAQALGLPPPVPNRAEPFRDTVFRPGTRG